MCFLRKYEFSINSMDFASRDRLWSIPGPCRGPIRFSDKGPRKRGSKLKYCWPYPMLQLMKKCYFISYNQYIIHCLPQFWNTISLIFSLYLCASWLITIRSASSNRWKTFSTRDTLMGGRSEISRGKRRLPSYRLQIIRINRQKIPAWRAIPDWSG